MHNVSLKDEIVFVTGATSGFGKAIAKACHAYGAKVIICGRRSDRLEALANELGNNVLHLVLDVRDQQAVQEAIRSLPSDFKPVTVLINNAGLALGLEPAYNASLEDWEIMVDTNIKGMLYCTHALLPEMVQRECGYIINIGSTAGTYPYPGANTYGATKAFVHQFSLNLRSDVTNKGVRVTCIEPGLAETEFSIVRFHGDTSRAKNVYENTIALTAEDIAHTVLWCLTLPPHININVLEMMPVTQACGPLKIERKG